MMASSTVKKVDQIQGKVISGEGNSKVSVSSVCKRCRKPLNIDPSVNTLDQSQWKEVTAPLVTQKDEETLTFPEKVEHCEEDENISKRDVLAREADNDMEGCGFTLLGETGHGSIENLGHEAKVEHYEEVENISKRDVLARKEGNDMEGSGFTLLGETGPDSIENLGHEAKVEHYEEDENISKRDLLAREADYDLEGSGITHLGETGPGSIGNLGHKTEVIDRLFDILTGKSEVDHPLCEECTDGLRDLLDHQLKMADDECKDYWEFVKKLENKEESENEAELAEELRQLKLQEESLMQQLQAVEEERAQTAKLLKKESEKTRALEEEEERFLKDYNELKRQVQELDDEEASVDTQLRSSQEQLDLLKKTNVFNATFHICDSGHFGTINNFRLGRLPSVPVEWNEINAAWGQTALLLHSLAKFMNLTFKRYRIVPYGNNSYIESLTENSKKLPLYGTGGFRFFWDTKFDQAMVAFLDCFQQFKEEVEKVDAGFCLPYKMYEDKIEDPSSGTSYSLKIQNNSEEQWTKAMKFMLTNMKWGLEWVSSQFANK